MKERGILFKGRLVRAILEGRKTQTRRVVRCQTRSKVDLMERCPYGVPGDRLYVRETWFCGTSRWKELREDLAADYRLYLVKQCRRELAYRADIPDYRPANKYGWRPSIHMPRWASRIDLEVTEVRVERLQEIIQDDIRAEGYRIEHRQWQMAQLRRTEAFVEGWDSTVKQTRAGKLKTANRPDQSWAANPWVWVVTFKRVEA